jgi:hypothetical protein
MEQAILRVDFKNKKLITNPQNNSGFYKNKHTLCDGEVTIFTTSNSGSNWQTYKQLRRVCLGYGIKTCSVYKSESAEILKNKGSFR